MEKETIKPSHVSRATTCYARSLKMPVWKIPTSSLICLNLPAREIRDTGHTCAGICKRSYERGYCVSMFFQRAVRLLWAATSVILSMNKDDLSAYQL
jgi:hypothetical protein